MNKFITVSIILSCLLLASCKVINVVSIDHMLPADICFPPEVKSVAIVNNTPQGEEKPIPYKENERSRVTLGTIGVLDGNAKLAAEELANNVAEGNYFDRVLICDSALRAGDHFSRETKLSQEEVKELTGSLGADMLLSLERVKIYFKRNMVYPVDYPIAQEALDATLSTLVRVYLPNRSEPLLGLNDQDSIFWVGSWNISDEIVDEASSFAAKLPVKHILPTWKTVNRYYYASGSVEMRDAAVCVREQSWDEAYELWQRAYQQKSEKMRMRAAFNIALYFELKDELENAKEWLERAKDIEEKKLPKSEDGKVLESTEDFALIALYWNDLSERITNMQKLNLQMSRFNGNF